jgi:hypothetical protein
MYALCLAVQAVSFATNFLFLIVIRRVAVEFGGLLDVEVGLSLVVVFDGSGVVVVAWAVSRGDSRFVKVVAGSVSDRRLGESVELCCLVLLFRFRYSSHNRCLSSALVVAQSRR